MLKVSGLDWLLMLHRWSITAIDDQS